MCLIISVESIAIRVSEAGASASGERLVKIEFVGVSLGIYTLRRAYVKLCGDKKSSGRMNEDGNTVSYSCQ